MDAASSYAVVQISALIEKPEHIEVTLMTTAGPHVLVFSDPNRDRTMRLLGGVAELIRANSGEAAEQFVD
jgi:hypothetical protein